MAVSKIAVMALVGILAVPILLGYALNLSEVTETDYKPDGESTNVTPLLQTSTAYTPTHGDIYKMNTSFDIYTAGGNSKVLPKYNGISTTLSSFNQRQLIYTISANDYVGLRLNYYSTDNIFINIGYSNDTDNIRMTIANAGGVEQVGYDKVNTIYYDASTLKIQFSYHTLDYTNISSIGEYTVGADDWIIRLVNTTNTQYPVLLSLGDTNYTQYVDFSKGFYFDNYARYNILLPDDTFSTLLTIDLDSITASNYKVGIYPMGKYSNHSGHSVFPLTLEKTTTDGVIKWEMYDNNHPTIRQELYYDSSRNDNTYQFSMALTQIDDYNASTFSYKTSVTADYVGGWPSLIGKTNSYQTYNCDIISYVPKSWGTISYDSIRLFVYPDNPRTPVIRVDDALFNGFAYSIIKDKEYIPADFKTNPTTTITDIQKYGNSLTFGGNTYTVDNTGNITLGTHKISVNGLKLESIPVPVGYENRINGNVISVSAQPSTIKFNGQWGASVSTIGNVATTYTKTEWVAGQFAWDGIDTNFLIVGLITCLGVFVALGIYVRKSGKGMIPLLIVCGCASALFFIMI